jgi:hypothetical protein
MVLCVAEGVAEILIALEIIHRRSFKNRAAGMEQ